MWLSGSVVCRSASTAGQIEHVTESDLRTCGLTREDSVVIAMFGTMPRTIPEEYPNMHFSSFGNVVGHSVWFHGVPIFFSSQHCRTLPKVRVQAPTAEINCTSYGPDSLGLIKDPRNQCWMTEAVESGGKAICLGVHRFVVKPVGVILNGLSNSRAAGV